MPTFVCARLLCNGVTVNAGSCILSQRALQNSPPATTRNKTITALRRELAVFKNILEASREMIIKIVRAIGIKSAAKAVSAGSKAILILGAVVSGGITLISFAPMANRLKVTLSKMI